VCAVVTVRSDLGPDRPIVFSHATAEIHVIAGLPQWLMLRLVQGCLLVAGVAQ